MADTQAKADRPQTVPPDPSPRASGLYVTGDGMAELAEANMDGLVDGATERPLPSGLDIRATEDWLTAYWAGVETARPEAFSSPRLSCGTCVDNVGMVPDPRCTLPIVSERCDMPCPECTDGGDSMCRHAGAQA